MKPNASLGKDLDVSAKTLEDLGLQKEKLEEERAVLLSRLEETETKIIAVQAEYGAVYNKTTKLLKLPPEVTCMIFTCAADGYSRARKNLWGEKARPGAVPLLPEVVVSHVCRYWRAVSLSYPRLWTSFRYNGACHELSPVDRFKAYLERSANLDLELWLDFSLVIMEEDRAINLSMLQLAVAHAQRWNCVTLMLDPESKILPEITHRLKALHVPKLEHFALCSEGDDIDLARRNSNTAPLVDLKTTIFKSGAPRLSSVHLDGATYIKCSPPMANITTLRIEPDVMTPRQAYNGKAILSILRLPSLEHLSLIGILFQLQDISSLRTIEMNKLKSLRISDHDAMCLLLAYIRAPLLDMLTIQSVWLPAELGTLTSFGREPYFFPSLNRLNVLDVSVTTLSGAEFLIPLTQTAREIMFAQDDYEDSILLLLPEIHSDHTFWPKLERLSVNMDVEDEMDSILHLISMDGRPQTKLTLFVPSSIKKTWKSTEQDYGMLARLCDIKVLQPKGFGASTWPPSQDQSSYQFWWEQDDPFEIDEI